MSHTLKTLISKLNPTTRRAAERAASLCMSRGHYEVDVEHLFLALLEDPRSDLVVLCRRFDVPSVQLQQELEQALREFRGGNTRTPVFSPHLPVLFEQGWLIASLESDAARVRSAHLLLALLTEPRLSQLALRSSPLFSKFLPDDLRHRLDALTQGSEEAVEASLPAAVDGGTSGPGTTLVEATGRTPALDQFTSSLTRLAREGRIDPVVGREAEIRQVIDILLRRRQNNPILTGEPGVGKTAVVEGLALRVAQDDVPSPLRGVDVRVLDMGLLQAGASVKGEFENRLKQVIDEVRRSPQPIILFIDEAHTMIGAGGPAGQGDAANLLKPALARGELRTIAATTWSEYKKYFEKDAALARRFQVVKVDEPDEPTAIAMLRAMAARMEQHFQVRILEDAVTAAVRLSARYLSGRQLPDKAISVLDTACAKVALGQRATPAVIEDARRRLERIDLEIRAQERDAAIGRGDVVRLAQLRSEREAVASRLAQDEARWQQERAQVEEILRMRAELERAGAPSSSEGGKGRRRNAVHPAVPLPLQQKLDELAALQGEAPLVPLQVDAHAVADIVASWTGIPLGKMVKDEIRAVLHLQEMLQARVVGQPHALQAVAQRVRTARAQLQDPHQPKAVFLFIGPSGVGKTETALALAEALYGGERNLVTINMSEYQEAHSVAGLKGAPPGYVGYGEGGVLTEAVRRKPYSVVLLDEVEKAHPDVLELFFQVFDKGVMDDAEGREIDFRNTVIILTSNVGSATIMQACLNKPAEERPDPEALIELLKPQLYKAFKPAFLGRLEVVPYYPLADEALERIIRLKLDRIGRRVAEYHKARFDYDEAVVEAVLARCTEVDSGARNVDHILNGTLLPELAEKVLARMADGVGLRRVRVTTGEDGRFACRVS